MSYDFNKSNSKVEKKLIKDLIQGQIDIAARLVAIYSENPLLKSHFSLLV